MSAQAQVATAQAALDALTGPDATGSAQAQLAAAEAAARSAQAALDELTSPDAKAQRDAQVSAARAQPDVRPGGSRGDPQPDAGGPRRGQGNVHGREGEPRRREGQAGSARGTVTWLPDEGAMVERGDPLYELDGQPSGVLMYGDRPAWRAHGRRGSKARTSASSRRT